MHRIAEAARAAGAAAVEALEARRLLSWTPGEAGGWTIAGTGDFNGDGYVDIVWRNQPVAGSPTPGQVRIQYMQGATTIGTADITVQGQPFHLYSGTQATAQNPNFIVGAVGEFGMANSPGPELVVFNGSTKLVVLWGLDDNQRTISYEVGQLNNTQWYIVGAGDFTGDGITDILWWNSGKLADGTPVSGGGNLGIWQLNAQRKPSNWIGIQSPGTPPAEWRVIAADDFDGDGKPDIAWQTRGANSQVRVWKMNGATIVQDYNPISMGANLNGQVHHIAAIGNIDGAGTKDLLIRQTNSTNNWVLYMNGGAPPAWTSTGALPAVPQSDPPVLTSVTATQHAANVTWVDCSYETSYDIYIRQGTSGAWQYVKTVPANSTSTTISGLQSETQYFVQVRANTSAGPFSSIPLSFTTWSSNQTWTGAGGDNLWSNPDNWSDHRVPDPSDDVTINTAAVSYIKLTGTQTIKSLKTSHPIQVEGTLKVLTTAEVTIPNGITVPTYGKLKGGTYLGSGSIVGSGATVEDIVLQTTLNVTSSIPLNVAGSVTFDGGMIVVQNSALRLSVAEPFAGTGTILLDHANLALSTHVTLSSGITVAGAGQIWNYGGSQTLINYGTIVATDTNNTPLIIRPGQFVNHGTLRAAGGPLEVRPDAATWQSTANSVIEVQSGKLSLLKTWSHAGLFVVSGGILELGGEFDVASVANWDRTGGTVEITGKLYNTDNTLTLNADTGTWHLAGGQFIGGTLQGNDGAKLIATMTSNLIGLTIVGNVFASAASATWVGLSNVVLDNAVIVAAGNFGIATNAVSGTGEFIADGSEVAINFQLNPVLDLDLTLTGPFRFMTTANPHFPESFTNNGTLTLNGSTIFDLPVINNGTIHVHDLLWVKSTITNSGDIIVHGSGRYYIGTSYIDGSLTALSSTELKLTYRTRIPTNWTAWLEVSVAGGEWTYLQDVTATSGVIVFDNLTPGTAYQYRIISQNGTSGARYIYESQIVETPTV